ncbi:hypothetical protein AB0O72_33260, partial [Streptomyces sp. NPDC088106]
MRPTLAVAVAGSARPVPSAAPAPRAHPAAPAWPRGDICPRTPGVLALDASGIGHRYAVEPAGRQRHRRHL